MASIAQQLVYVLPERISRGVVQFTRKKDAFYRYFETRDDMASPDGIGQSWVVKQPLTTGLAGGIEVGDIEDTNALQPNTGVSWVQRNMDLWPGIDQMSLAGFRYFTVTLKMVKGNFYFPLQLLKAQRLPAILTNTLMLNIDKVIENDALEEVKSFYTADSATQQIAKVSGSPTFAGGTPVAKSMAVITITAGRIRNFRQGMFIDAYSTGGVKRNQGVNLMVVAVSNKSKTITVADPLGLAELDNLAGGAIASTDVLVRANSYGHGVNGLDSWTKATGSIQNVSISEVPDLASYITSTGGILTELFLDTLIGDFIEGYDDQDLAGVTTHGVLRAHRADLVTFNTSQGMMQIQRQGAPLDRVTGFSEQPGTGGYGIVHHYGSMTVPIYASSLQIPQQLNLCNVSPGNFRRYVPPRASGMGSHSSFGSEVEFTMNFDGSGNIWRNISGTSPGATITKASNLFEAPYFRFVNRMCLDPRGAKATGLTESATLSYS